jgi:hypothetical protein
MFPSLTSFCRVSLCSLTSLMNRDFSISLSHKAYGCLQQFKPVLAKPPEPNGAPMDVDDDSTKGLAKIGGRGKKDETQSNGTVVATANGGGDSKGNTATARSGGRR